MRKQEEICKSVFKNGIINKEIYTAAWISLIDQIKENPYFPHAEAGK